MESSNKLAKKQIESNICYLLLCTIPLMNWSYHISKVVHGHGVSMLAIGSLQIVTSNLVAILNVDLLAELLLKFCVLLVVLALWKKKGHFWTPF